MKKSLLILLLLFAAAVYWQTKQDTTWKTRLSRIESQLDEIQKKNYERDVADFILRQLTANTFLRKTSSVMY